MTYNIRLDTPVDSINQWPHRKEKVFQLIKKYSPDVLGVQEALHHQVTDLLSNLPEYDYIGAGRDDGKTRGEYSAILFRKKILALDEAKTFWLSETPTIPGSKSWDAAITRVATVGVFKDLTRQKTLVIYNTHFDHLGKMAREKSAALIKQDVSTREALPVIVMGDFNCERNEPPYQVMTADTGIKLLDSKPKDDDRGTFCTFKINAIPCRGIDYIFYSADWRVNSYDVPNDNSGEYYPSDHLPVLVTLTLE